MHLDTTQPTHHLIDGKRRGLPSRHAHRRQGGRDQRAHGNVVDANHRHLTGNRNMLGAQRRNEADGDHIVKRQHGARLVLQKGLRAPIPPGERRRIRGDTLQPKPVHRAQRSHDAPARTLLPTGLRTGDIGDFRMSQPDQMVHRRLKTGLHIADNRFDPSDGTVQCNYRLGFGQLANRRVAATGRTENDAVHMRTGQLDRVLLDGAGLLGIDHQQPVPQIKTAMLRGLDVIGENGIGKIGNHNGDLTGHAPRRIV